ncbi:MAG: PAS domain S-box protein, partial [Bacteroidota bacterium]
MDSRTRIVQDISLLYELALSVGRSLDFEENCDTFLSVLMSRKALSFAELWVRRMHFLEDGETPHYQLSHAFPHQGVTEQQIPIDHPAVQIVQQNQHFSFLSGDSKFASLVQQSFGEGVYLVYSMDDFGFLKLFASNRAQVFSNVEINQLINVLKKFRTSLEACQVYDRMIRETRTRKKVQKALELSKGRYKDLFENMYDAMVSTDQEGNIIDSNKAARELIGIPEKAQANIFNVVHPADRSKILESAALLTSVGFISNLEVRVQDAKGQIRHVQVNSNAIRQNGAYAGARNLIRDVTDQRTAELRIFENERKLQKIVDSSLDGIIIINAEGNVIEWSNAAAEVFGFTREETMGQNLSDLIIPHQYRSSHKAGMKRFFETGEGPVLNNRIEITGLHKKGNEFPLELSITHLTIDGKHIFSAFVRDITERKQAETDLVNAKQAAEQARLAERQFLANMSHEIRTPMNAVIGMTHLLFESSPTKDQMEYLDALKFSADSLMSIISNILDLSKIEAGELEFENRIFNLKELLKAMVQTFQFKLKEKPVSVVMDFDPMIQHQVIGDPTRLNQILTNLLSNAGKFTHYGTIGIGAYLVESSEEQYLIEFTVHDTGIGIPEDKMETIFQNFKQVNERSAEYGGTGLGLAIVKQLVEMQNGTIMVTSKVGNGTQFKFSLPFGNSGQTAAEITGQDIPEEQEEDSLENVRVLVVEDNAMNMKLITRILDIWKCDYLTSYNGYEALKVIDDQTFDIVLMDLHMPILDGAETTRKIRSMHQNPNQHVPIVAMTAAALLDEQNRVFEAGMNEFITKPFSPKNLKRIIIKLLEIKPQLKASKSKREAHQANVEVVSINLDYLKEFSGNDPIFIREMVDMFILQIPGALEEIEKHYFSKSWERLYEVVHRIKPNFLMVGLKDTVQVILVGIAIGGMTAGVSKASG